MEKMERMRALERASLRHKNKNNYTKQLKKYAGDKSAQEAYKNLNFSRREISEKLNELVQNMEEENSSSYDEEDF